MLLDNSAAAPHLQHIAGGGANVGVQVIGVNSDAAPHALHQAQLHVAAVEVVLGGVVVPDLWAGRGGLMRKGRSNRSNCSKHLAVSLIYIF